MAAKGKDDRDDDDHRGDDNNRRERYVSRMPDRKYAYFRDDQITFLVTHSDNVVTQEQLDRFATAINGMLHPRLDGIIEKTPEAISFPRLTDEEIRQSQNLLPPRMLARVSRTFSLLKCELTGGSGNPARLLDIANRLKKQFPRNADDAQKTFAGLTVQGTSFNWLTTITSQSGGTGGPGGKPSPYVGNRKTAPYHLDIVKQLQDKNIYGDGAGVDVIILDTAPCAHELVAAYKEWPDHPLIATLLGPNGRLHLYPAPYEELLRLTCTSLNDYDFNMQDHGSFIAGIAHSIVPRAEIHLIEVLNQFGVGDLWSFIRGLIKARAEIIKPGRPAVFSCSWMLVEPLDISHCRHLGQTGDLDAEFEQAVLKYSSSDKDTPYMLEFLFGQLFGLGKQAIAAAGNDGRAGDAKRPPARYPAALSSVKGAGATVNVQSANGKYQPTAYSNFSESPDKRGVVIRGIVTLGGEEGEGKGVLGLYLGEFPYCCRNESKWAWWAGTSFATPILAGAVASILSRPQNNITTTQDAIKKLYAPGVKIIKQGRAGKTEDALPVRQS